MKQTEIDKLHKKYSKKLSYYTKKYASKKITKEEYELIIRPFSYSLKWLSILQKIYGASVNLSELRKDALNFLKLGTCEEFMIRKINREIKPTLDYEILAEQAKTRFRDHYITLKNDSKHLYAKDFLDKIINEENEHFDYE